MHIVVGGRAAHRPVESNTAQQSCATEPDISLNTSIALARMIEPTHKSEESGAEKSFTANSAFSIFALAFGVVAVSTGAMAIGCFMDGYYFLGSFAAGLSAVTGYHSYFTRKLNDWR